MYGLGVDGGSIPVAVLQSSVTNTRLTNTFLNSLHIKHASSATFAVHRLDCAPGRRDTDEQISTLSWSASFYPQPILSWKRKSTHGLAIDFFIINVLGFTCYAISNSAFLYSPLIREQYAVRHSRSPTPTVRFNDLVFAVHAVILTVLTYTQFFSSVWGFRVGKYQRVSRPIAGILWGCVFAVIVIVLLVVSEGNEGGRDGREWAWIDVVCYRFVSWLGGC